MSKLEELLLDLKSKDQDRVIDALDQLGDLGDASAVPFLIKMLDTASDEELVESILWTMSRIASSETLVTLLDHPNEAIIIEVLDALGRRQARETANVIIPFLTHGNAEIRSMATWALGKLVVGKAYSLFFDLLKNDEVPAVRAHAAWAIGKYGRPEAVSQLTEIRALEQDETVLYNMDEAINAIESTQDPRQQGLSVVVYECPKREVSCIEKKTRSESRSDDLVEINIIFCDTCASAKICKVELVKKIK
jgi:HEAT repeat protein